MGYNNFVVSNKNESDGDGDYKCTLPQKYVKLAATELNETDTLRTKSLQQFREWIVDHPQIKHCRTDTQFLLRFLRAKKFSLPRAKESLEKYLTARLTCNAWFKELDIEDQNMNDLYDSGIMVPLKELDSQGRQIVINRPQNFDLNRFKSTDAFRIDMLFLEYLMDLDISQVAGLIFAIDGSQLTLKYMNLFSLMEFKTMLTTVQEACPVRIKEFHFINFPTFATVLAEIAINVLSTKMKKRVIFSKTIEDFKKVVDPKILPKEYGGEISAADMMKDFKEKLKNNRSKVLENDHSLIILKNKVDTSCKTSEIKSELSGNFRKLEID